MPTFNLATPDYGVAKESRPRVNNIQFGDGYSQRSSDGINTNLARWPMQFTLRTRTLIDSIDAFLAARGAIESFDWTTPSGNAVKVICREWRTMYNHDGDCSLSCVFEEVPE
jgi:phage-related protein